MLEHASFPTRSSHFDLFGIAQLEAGCCSLLALRNYGVVENEGWRGLRGVI